MAPNREIIAAALGVELGGGDSHSHFRSHRACLVVVIRSAAIGDAQPIGGDLAIRSTRNNRPARPRRRRPSRAAVSAVGANRAISKLRARAAIVAVSIGGVVARLRALRIGGAHHQGEEDGVRKSRRGAAPRRLKHTARGARWGSRGTDTCVEICDVKRSTRVESATPMTPRGAQGRQGAPALGVAA